MTRASGIRKLWLTSVVWTAAIALASPEAAASVEGELAYHRGVVAYGENDLEAAKRHFEAALAESPNDASALQYLGIIANKQDRLEEAIELFERAVAADPEDPAIRFMLGVSLLRRDRADEARVEFDRVLAVEPGNARAEFYAGVSDYRRQKYSETVLHMQAAISLDPSIRLQARYYMGLAEVFMGNLSASTAAFADAASLSPSDPLAISADMLGKRIQPESRWWGVDVGAGVEYDSNPTFVGSDVQITEGIALLESPKRIDDATGVFTLDTYYDLTDSEQLTVRLGYSAFVSVHDEAERVDQFTNAGWVDVGWTQGDFRAGARFDYATSRLDLSKSFLDMRRFAPSITYTNDEWGVTQLLYQFHDVNYLKSSALRNNFNPDGELHLLGLSQFFYLPAPFTYARFGLGYEKSATEGTEFDYNGVEIAAGFGIELPMDMRAAALLQYYYRLYDHRTIVGNPVSVPVGTGPKRKDNSYRLKLELTAPVTQYVEIAIRGVFTWTGSNVGDYDFNRHVIGSYFTFTF
jgi:tetratricopeptide (TPR) repeat protein